VNENEVKLLGNENRSMNYEQDYYAWIIHNAMLLRQGKLQQLDVGHLIEELEAMGAKERRELESRIVVLIMHLLKWQYQAINRCASWKGTIIEQRRQIQRLIKMSPSLKRFLSEMLQENYAEAVERAVVDTGLAEEIFPAKCSFCWEEIIDNKYYPD
jgi:hypothetical protein